MKKNYLKPETISVNMEIENYILGGSRMEVEEDGAAKPSPVNGSRGEWGNVWSENK